MMLNGWLRRKFRQTVPPGPLFARVSEPGSPGFCKHTNSLSFLVGVQHSPGTTVILWEVTT